ncbi:DUF3213 domain-containing protein [Thermococcus aciditolerans]|uniref:DUF3213 domain-containing protein n=1 Tax=Thermococcus aciditolerans TaxID=2598455 RepID=A0A5C0SLC5_9EURY|nr:DUF3213 domain-containing protein [Thermococcus aciditolerans]QEK15285.1 DUF3213 domain-containing protein [Thermococcus aciditolerans]
MSERVYNKTLIRMDLKFGRITPEEARARQYELLKDGRIWRAFINGYAKNGFVVFDGETISKEEVLEKLRDFEPEVTSIGRLTVAELVESSYSWNNILSKA